MVSTFEAKIVKEDDKYIFDFAGINHEHFDINEAKQRAQQWISDNRTKIQKNGHFFLRLENNLIKIDQ